MNILKGLGLALYAVTIACNTNVAAIPPSPLPTVSSSDIERIEKAKACESQKARLGRYQWNWAQDNCFFAPAVSIECSTCSPQDQAAYTKLFTDGYEEVAEAFGMEPYAGYGFRGLQIKILHESKGRYGIWNGADEYPFDAGKLTIADQRGVVHEITHVFDFWILGKHGQRWFAEGLASYIPDKELLLKKNQSFLAKVKQDADFFQKNSDWYNAHNVGYLYFSELITRGLTSEKNRMALQNLREKKPYGSPTSWASPRIINESYEDALELERGSLSYLLEMLSPGIRFNNYGQPRS